MIKNPSKLTLNSDSKAILSILTEGLEISNPSLHLKKYILKNKIQLPSSQIDLKKYNHLFLIAIGKSAGTMAEFISNPEMIDKMSKKSLALIEEKFDIRLIAGQYLQLIDKKM